MGSSSSCLSPVSPLNASSADEDGDQGLLEKLSGQPSLLSKPVPGFSLLLGFGMAQTWLHVACERKQLQVVRCMCDFLSRGSLETAQAALGPYCRRMGLPLPVSVAEGLRLAVDMCNGKGQTPLMYACYASCPQVVKYLLQQGANLWAVDRCGRRTALHYAAIAGCAASVAALLRSAAALQPRGGMNRYVDVRSLSGMTPLHFAAYYERLDVMVQLLRHDPDINAPTAGCGAGADAWLLDCDEGATPLHFAAARGHVACALELLRHYAARRHTGLLPDPRLARNAAGRQPWQLAAAQNPGLRYLALLLQPGQPLPRTPGSPEDALPVVSLGPPPLATIAAAALRQKLLAAVEAAEAAVAGMRTAGQSHGGQGAVEGGGGGGGTERGSGSGDGGAASKEPTAQSGRGLRQMVTMPAGVGGGTAIWCGAKGSSGGGGIGGGIGGSRKAVLTGRGGGVPRAVGGGGGSSTGMGVASSCLNGSEDALDRITPRALSAGNLPARHRSYTLLRRGDGIRSPVQLYPRLHQHLHHHHQQQQQQQHHHGHVHHHVHHHHHHHHHHHNHHPGGGSVVSQSSRSLQSGGVNRREHPFGVQDAAAAAPAAAAAETDAEAEALEDLLRPCHGGGPVSRAESLSAGSRPPSQLSVGSGGGRVSPLPQIRRRDTIGECPVSGCFRPGGAALGTRQSSLRRRAFSGMAAAAGRSIGGGGGAAAAVVDMRPWASSLTDAEKPEAAAKAMAAAAAATDPWVSDEADEGGDGGSGTDTEMEDTETEAEQGGGGGGGSSSSSGGCSTCNVCYARPEAVAPADCRHGLCGVCARELCQGLTSKPLPCPFCRRLVSTFVRLPGAAAVAGPAAMIV